MATCGGAPVTEVFAYPVTPHLIGSHGTSGDTFIDAPHTARVLRECSLVQPKLDGINLGLRHRDGEVELVLKDRGPTLRELERLHPLIDALRSSLASLARTRRHRLRVFGELVRWPAVDLHSWTVFDVYDEEAARFVSYRQVVEVAGALGCATVSVLHRGPLESIGHLLAVLGDRDDAREGCVVRVEKARAVERYKFVRPGFRKTEWVL